MARYMQPAMRPRAAALHETRIDENALVTNRSAQTPKVTLANFKNHFQRMLGQWDEYEVESNMRKLRRNIPYHSIRCARCLRKQRHPEGTRAATRNGQQQIGTRIRCHAGTALILLPERSEVSSPL